MHATPAPFQEIDAEKERERDFFLFIFFKLIGLWISMQTPLRDAGHQIGIPPLSSGGLEGEYGGKKSWRSSLTKINLFYKIGSFSKCWISLEQNRKKQMNSLFLKRNWFWKNEDRVFPIFSRKKKFWMIFEWVAVFGVYNMEDFSFSFLKLHLFIHPPIRFPIGANSTQEACLFKKKEKYISKKRHC